MQVDAMVMTMSEASYHIWVLVRTNGARTRSIGLMWMGLKLVRGNKKNTIPIPRFNFGICVGRTGSHIM